MLAHDSLTIRETGRYVVEEEMWYEVGAVVAAVQQELRHDLAEEDD